MQVENGLKWNDDGLLPTYFPLSYLDQDNDDAYYADDDDDNRDDDDDPDNETFPSASRYF